MHTVDFAALKIQIESEIGAITSLEGLEEFRLRYLGRKGVLAQITATIPSLSAEERPVFGRQANELKERLTQLFQEKGVLLAKEKAEDAYLDIGLPGTRPALGHRHPLTTVIGEICQVFIGLGFQVVEGPEVETEYNNFTALNIPLEHPSRDAFDTFYIEQQATGNRQQVTGNRQQVTGDRQQVTGDRQQAAGCRQKRTAGSRLLLRSHTSPVQIRAMSAQKPPLAVVVPGKVYRPDAVDASHSFMFHQIEGFLVDKAVSMAHLKGVLNLFIQRLFGEKVRTRFRPHFFPFTEPSAEVDISCIICQGRGCSVCGRKGWLEILGSGMIHPNVFRHVGYDPKKYTGFAFGMGVDRIAMLKYGIHDIRLFYENDMRFLRQF